jgi:uncharacterized membrane protein
MFMLAELTSRYHLHPIVDHFTIALLAFGIAAELLAAAAILISRGSTSWLPAWSEKLRSTSLLLMIGGAGAAVLSYFTGDIEAERLWDTMSPAAQQILAPTDGTGRYLSHAALGQYLMSGFLIFAVWRVLIEFSQRLARWRIAFLIVATVAVGALLYQGKTGGELVYEYGVGKTGASGSSQQDAGTATVDSHQGVQHEASAGSAPPENLPLATEER